MNEVIGGVYRVIEKIGQGGSGSVYKAYHERLEKYVVIKRISTLSPSSASVRNEVDMLKSLKHTYLPQVIDFIRNDDEAYTVMDFIDGSDLSVVRKSKKISISDIVKYSIQLCEAVKYLHSQNPPIIHSDIKPANIMITKDNDICLIDFNVSLLFDKELKAIGATKGYASPEQVNAGSYNSAQFIDLQKDAGNNEEELTATEILSSDTETELLDATALLDNDTTELCSATVGSSKGDISFAARSSAIGVLGGHNVIDEKVKVSRGIDERSDIYSIGAVMYYMITGEKPSSDFSKIKPLRSFNKKIPEGLILITEKAMSFERRNRYQKADDMLKALNSIMKLDKRYRALKIQRIIISAACFLGMIASATYTVYGYDLILQERADKYLGYISEADAAILSGDFDTAQALIETAKGFIPSNPEAYYEEILMLYEKGSMEECIKHYHSNTHILDNQDFSLKSNLYFVLGNAFFELEDYVNAAINYNKALSIKPDYKDCYRDLAISYVRNDRIDDAVDILEKAENSGLSNDQLLLMKGEIEAYKGNNSLALEYISRSVNETDNEYIMFRGISIYVEISEKETENVVEHSKNATKLIEDNLGRFSSLYKNFVLEMLANQYQHLGDYTGVRSYYLKAIDEYRTLIKTMSQNYIAYKNCFEVQYLIGDYDDALDTLGEMNTLFPEDYWVMMNCAFTCIKKQEKLNSNERSYDMAYNYYQQAEEFYKTYSKNGKTDPNMDMLRTYIEQLIDGGWIKE